MEPSYSHSWSLQCELEGPLASHISSFTKSLENQGYSQDSSHVQTRLVADFSLWLKKTHAALPAITGQRNRALADLELKKKMLEKATPHDGKPGIYGPDDQLLAFLNGL